MIYNRRKSAIKNVFKKNGFLNTFFSEDWLQKNLNSGKPDLFFMELTHNHLGKILVEDLKYIYEDDSNFCKIKKEFKERLQE